MPLDEFHVPDDSVFGGRNLAVGGLTSTFWEENCVMQDELDYGVRKCGGRKGLFCLVWLLFSAEDGGDGLKRYADTIVVSRERSEGSLKRKRKVSCG